jgi:hypothetical protein
MPQESAVKRRVAPSVPITIELLDDSGAKFTRNFRLSFDFNAFARIEEKTDVRVLGMEIWAKLSPRVVGAMLWAGVLALHPEYDTEDEEGEPTDEGLEAIRSYIDAGNVDFIGDKLWEAYLITLPKERADALRKWRRRRPKPTPRWTTRLARAPGHRSLRPRTQR